VVNFQAKRKSLETRPLSQSLFPVAALASPQREGFEAANDTPSKPTVKAAESTGESL
jgi:hypothetical protein